MAATKKEPRREACTAKRACSGLERVLDETKRFKTKRPGAGLETFVVSGGPDVGAAGVAYRTGGRTVANLISLRFCPFCAQAVYVNRAAPAARSRS